MKNPETLNNEQYLMMAERHIVDGELNIDALAAEISTTITSEDVASVPYYKNNFATAYDRARRHQPEEGHDGWHEIATFQTQTKVRRELVDKRTGQELKDALNQTEAVDTMVSIIDLFVARKGYYSSMRDPLDYANFKSGNFADALVFLSERLDTQNAKLLGERVGALLNQGNRGKGWANHARVVTTIAAKRKLGISERDEFMKFNSDPDYDASIEQSEDKAAITYLAYLRAIKYDRAAELAPARRLYDQLMATGRLVRDNAYRKQAIEALTTADIYESFVDKFAAEKMLATALDVFAGTCEQAAPYSQNAKAIAGLIKRQKQEKNFSYTQLIKLSNQLGESLNHGKVLPEGIELPLLDEKSIGDLPIALGRLHYVMTETGSNELSEDKAVMLDESVEIAKTLAAAGAQKKAEERPVSIGDVVLEFPNRTAEELHEIIEQLEAGMDLNDIHENYRLHNQRTGGRAFWRKYQSGYGIIS